MRKKWKENRSKLKINANHVILLGAALLLLMIFILGKMDEKTTESLMKEAFIILFICGYILLALVYFISKNITLRQHQRELLEMNGKLQEKIRILDSLESIFFSIFYVDLPKNRYESVFLAPWFPPNIETRGVYSEIVKELVEKTVVEEYRKNLKNVLEPDYIKKALNKEQLSEIKNSYYIDYQAIQRGEIKWRRLTVNVVDLDEEGNPKHLLILLQDVNEEKEKEHNYQVQILREARKAKHANEAKTEFLRRISHDIRTPINGIQGMVKMAQHCPNNKKKQEEYWGKVWTSSQFLLDLVNDVLDMSKLESGEIVLENRTFSLAEILEEVDLLLESQASQRKIQYITDGEEDTEMYLIGSPLHVRQILLNIGGNAIKYGKEGGYVKVKSRIIEREEDMVIYEFVCEDDGIGMSKEFQQKMFEPFVQEADDARTTYQGTGLGLSIVDKLVKKMKGTIEVISQKGLGTTFKITIPFEIDQAAEANDILCDEGVAYSLEGMKALLVEDNELNMEITEFMLKEQGMIVEKAWNGREAVKAFEKSEEGYFDVILMDVMMPVMNGMDAAREIRRLPRADVSSIPIIAITANAFSDDIEKSKEAGMNDHISKPIDEARLIDTMKKYGI